MGKKGTGGAGLSWEGHEGWFKNHKGDHDVETSR